MESALVALIDDLWRRLDQGGPVLLLLLYLTAVFETVDYDCLTHCLDNVEVWGTNLQWPSSFLYGWGQGVVLGERLSPCYMLVSGILHGAVLSLMLFNIYMHRLVHLIWGFGMGCHQYADDMQLHLLLDGQLGSAPDNLTGALEAMAGGLQ